MEEEKKRGEKQNSNILASDIVSEILVDGVAKGVRAASDLVPDVGVVDFLKDKFNIVGEAAVEVAAKLPQTVIEKIDNFNGEGLSNIASAVSNTIKSIELPDIDFPDIDF